MNKYSPLCDVAWAGARALVHPEAEPAYFITAYIRMARNYARKGFRL